MYTTDDWHDLFLPDQLTMALYVEMSWSPYQLTLTTGHFLSIKSHLLCRFNRVPRLSKVVSCHLPHLTWRTTKKVRQKSPKQNWRENSEEMRNRTLAPRLPPRLLPRETYPKPKRATCCDPPYRFAPGQILSLHLAAITTTDKEWDFTKVQQKPLKIFWGRLTLRLSVPPVVILPTTLPPDIFCHSI